MNQYKVSYASNIRDFTLLSLDTDERFVISKNMSVTINGKKYKFLPGMDAPIIGIKEKLNPKELIGSEIAID